jgi:hypothetical protein
VCELVEEDIPATENDEPNDIIEIWSGSGVERCGYNFSSKNKRIALLLAFRPNITCACWS